MFYLLTKHGQVHLHDANESRMIELLISKTISTMMNLWKIIAIISYHLINFYIYYLYYIIVIYIITYLRPQIHCLIVILNWK